MEPRDVQALEQGVGKLFCKLKKKKKKMTKIICFISGNPSWIPQATARKFHKRGGFEQQRCILSQFWGPQF